MKICKRHRWRVGSSNAKIINGKIVKDSLNIWCEKCGKCFKAYYNSKLIFKKYSSSNKRGKVCLKRKS